MRPRLIFLRCVPREYQHHWMTLNGDWHTNVHIIDHASDLRPGEEPPQRNRACGSFEEAKGVLTDLRALVREDDDAIGEQRFVSLGQGARGRILVVVWTLRDNDEKIRLISAWKANAQQRKRYENQPV